MNFKTKIIQSKKTATGIKIPPEIIESLNAGKKPPIRISVNGYTYRSTVAVMGGDYMVGLSSEHRNAANVAGGDEVDVTIELDTEPRVVEIPSDFEKALSDNPAAKKNFDSLSNSKKQGLVIPIKDAKTEETKLKRIEKAINLLNEGKA